MAQMANRSLITVRFSPNNRHIDVKTLQRAKHHHHQHPLPAAIALAAQIDWANFPLPRSDRDGRGESPRAYMADSMTLEGHTRMQQTRHS